jgi:hypothetical protein
MFREGSGIATGSDHPKMLRSCPISFALGQLAESRNESY